MEIEAGGILRDDKGGEGYGLFSFHMKRCVCCLIFYSVIVW